MVTVFCGDPPLGLALGDWDRHTGAEDPTRAARQRRTEDESALAGWATPVHLDFVDGQYRSDDVDASGIARVIGETRDSVGANVIYAPCAIGGHPDHALVRDAAVELSQSGASVRFYADLPYAARSGWPAWVTGGTADEYVRPEISWTPHSEILASRGLVPSVISLSEDEKSEKVTALRRYATQFEVLNKGPLHRLEQDWFLAVEVVWARVSGAC